MVDIVITNTECKITSPLTKEQMEVIQDQCSFEVEGSEYKAQAFRDRTHGKCKWDGKRRLFNTQTRVFPVGLLSRIIKLFRLYGIQVNMIDKRIYLPVNSQIPIAHIESRQYQTNTVLSSILYGNGIVKAATGAGKTVIGALTISALKKNAVFIVHTRDLLYQTKESFERIFKNRIGQIGDGVVDLQPITVATVQSLSWVMQLEYEDYKYDEDYTSCGDMIVEDSLSDLKRYRAEILKWARTVGIVIFDEVQRVGSRTAYAARFMFPNANNAYGYSASPWRDDGCDMMIEAAFGERIVDVTASELIKQNYLVQPIITIKTLTNNIWSGKTYEQIYKSAIVENIFRNMQVISDAIEQYNLGRNTLILITQVKHGEIIEKMLRDSGLPGVFISGKSGMKKRSQVISDMRNGKAPIVIASTIADVGLDVPRLQSIVEAGAGKSSVTALQRLGRIMRPFQNKDMCYFTTYHDTAPYLNRQIDRKIDIWKTEPEFIIKRC